MVNVLLIDDEVADRALVVHALRQEFSDAELRIREITDARAFREALAHDPPDVVITDYRLRWTDGLQALKEVKGRWDDVPVLMFTDSGSEEIAVAAMKAGLDDYVLKSPQHFSRLAAAARLAIERGRVQRKVADLTHRLDDLLNRLNVGVFRAGEIGGLLEANPACLRILGCKRIDDVRGMPLLSYCVNDEDAERLTREFRRRGCLRAEEVLIRRMQGGVVWVEVTVAPATNTEGGRVIDGLVEDVTARKDAEELLRESDARLNQDQRLHAMGRLVGGVAHDFNNLLTTITINADLAGTALVGQDLGVDHVEQIRQTADRASRLVQQLLAFSRRQVMEPRPLQLNDIVGELQPILCRVIGEDIEISLRLAPDLDIVCADPTQLEQVIVNLALNARDAMPEGGVLAFETANTELDDAHASLLGGIEPGAYIELGISDTGHGMPPAILAHAFEPFFTTKAEGNSSGLGLAIVDGIVRQSGGAIEVDSQPLTGTTFRLYFPRDDDVVRSEPPRLPLRSSRHGPETVLVVEDDEALRNVIGVVLKDYGYTVFQACGGNQAVEIIEDLEGPLHLVLSDVVMPGLGVTEMVERIRLLHPAARLILTSGHSSDALVRRGIEEGNINFLRKPFSTEILLRAVRTALDD